MKKNSVYLACAGLSLVMAVSASCGAGASSGSDAAGTTANRNATTNNADAAGSAVPAEKEARDTSPVNISADALFDQPIYSALGSQTYDFMEKYRGREVTVTDLYLRELEGYEMDLSDERTPGGNQITCGGVFTDYLDAAPKIKALWDQGKPLKAVIKGTFREASVSSDDLWVKANPCVLVDIEQAN